MKSTDYAEHEVIKFFTSGPKSVREAADTLGIDRRQMTKVVRGFPGILEYCGQQKYPWGYSPMYKVNREKMVSVQRLSYEPVRPHPELDTMFHRAAKNFGDSLHLDLLQAATQEDKVKAKVKFAEQVFEDYERRVQAHRDASARIKARRKRQTTVLVPQSVNLANCWGLGVANVSQI